MHRPPRPTPARGIPLLGVCAPLPLPPSCNYEQTLGGGKFDRMRVTRTE